MARSKIADGKVKLIQELFESGVSMNQIQRDTSTSRNTVSDIKNGRRVYCYVCSIAHDGPQCKTAGELRKTLLENYETCKVCGNDHPGEPCPDMKKELGLIKESIDQSVQYDNVKVVDMRG